MTATLHLIRHAEADIDPYRYADHRAMGLSEVGQQQAAAAARRLSSVVRSVGPVIASPLARARETAAHFVADTGGEVMIEPRLAERTFPMLYGMTYAEVEARHGRDVAAALGTNSDQIDGYGAPSLLQCHQVVRELLQDLAARGCPDLCLVTHGGPLGWMLSVLLEPSTGSMARKLRFDHVGYTRLVLDESARLVRLEWLNRPLADGAW